MKEPTSDIYSQITQKLTQIGFTQLESEVYLHLLSNRLQYRLFDCQRDW